MELHQDNLTCSVKIEWCTPQGCIRRSLNYKTATLKLVRDECQDLYIIASSNKSPSTKFKVKSIMVHNKFMSDGKATIKFQDELCSMFICNAPAAQLVGFLRTILIKTTNPKHDKVNLLRKQLINGPKSFDEISPVTSKDLIAVKGKVLQEKQTTPTGSKKRKLEQDKTDNGPQKKKVNSNFSFINEPLTNEQKDILEACLNGHNIFFTGSAGTGKSFLLRRIIAALPPDVTVATASTGVAACHIGGITLHQFAGIGIAEGTLDHCYKLASRPSVAQNWRKCKHLIIDEISMISAEYFEKLEAVARYIRNNDKPFGGIQLIICGDFFQLPPVAKDRNKENVKFCFQTSVWERSINVYFELIQVHRQRDVQFINMLNKIRIGQASTDIIDKLKATTDQHIEQNGILATTLCSHTHEALTINELKLKKLSGTSQTYTAKDSDPTASAQLDQLTGVLSKIELKIGAQVMLVKNINIAEGLVNGARGVVTEFRENLPVVRFRNKEYLAKYERCFVKMSPNVTATRLQIPLRLAWAFSIHKSQGLTLDCVEMSLAKVFEAGQAYVALSRALSLETLRVLDFSVNQVWVNPDVLKFYKRFKRNLIDKPIPLGIKRIGNNGNSIKCKSKLKSMTRKSLVSIS